MRRRLKESTPSRSGIGVPTAVTPLGSTGRSLSALEAETEDATGLDGEGAAVVEGGEEGADAGVPELTPFQQAQQRVLPRDDPNTAAFLENCFFMADAHSVPPTEYRDGIADTDRLLFFSPATVPVARQISFLKCLSALTSFCSLFTYDAIDVVAFEHYRVAYAFLGDLAFYLAGPVDEPVATLRQRLRNTVLRFRLLHGSYRLVRHKTLGPGADRLAPAAGRRDLVAVFVAIGEELVAMSAPTPAAAGPRTVPGLLTAAPGVDRLFLPLPLALVSTPNPALGPAASPVGYAVPTPPVFAARSGYAAPDVLVSTAAAATPLRGSSSGPGSGGGGVDGSGSSGSGSGSGGGSSNSNNSSYGAGAMAAAVPLRHYVALNHLLMAHTGGTSGNLTGCIMCDDAVVCTLMDVELTATVLAAVRHLRGGARTDGFASGFPLVFVDNEHVEKARSAAQLLTDPVSPSLSASLSPARTPRSSSMSSDSAHRLRASTPAFSTTSTTTTSSTTTTTPLRAGGRSPGQTPTPLRRTPPPLLTRESDGDVYEDREEGGEEEGEEEDDEEVAAQEEIARLAEEAGLVPLGLAWVSYGHVALAVLMDVAHIRSRAHVKALLRAVQPELTLLDNHVAAQQAARAAPAPARAQSVGAGGAGGAGGAPQSPHGGLRQSVGAGGAAPSMQLESSQWVIHDRCSGKLTQNVPADTPDAEHVAAFVALAGVAHDTLALSVALPNALEPRQVVPADYAEDRVDQVYLRRKNGTILSSQLLGKETHWFTHLQATTHERNADSVSWYRNNAFINNPDGQFF